MIVVLIGTYTDFKTMKIPNKLTFPAAGAGIVLRGVAGLCLGMAAGNAVVGACSGVLDAILGWIAGAGLMIFVSMIPIGPSVAGGKFGMGDAKLLAAVGAILGWKLALISFYYFMISFGIISVVMLLRVIPWHSVYGLVMNTAMGVKAAPKIDDEKLTETRKKPIPAGVAIAMGALIAICFEKQTIDFFFGGAGLH